MVERVKTKVTEIRASLPPGVTIRPFYDRAQFVGRVLQTVTVNLMEGGLLVIAVLFVLLGSFQGGLLVALAIPLSMLFAFIGMYYLGITGNLMSLGAIDFGLIVDGAVIIVEAVMHQLSHSKKFTAINRLTQPQMDGEVNKAASKMMSIFFFMCRLLLNVLFRQGLLKKTPARRKLLIAV